MRVTEVSDEPLNVKVDGRWKPVSTDLQGRGSFSWLGRGGAEVAQHPFRPEFAERADEDALLTLSVGSKKVSFSLDDVKGSQLQRDLAVWSDKKNRVEYEDVFEGTDLVYEVEAGGVKELFELEGQPGKTGRNSWTWRIDADGLTLREEKNGDVLFENSEDEAVLVIPRPIMWDSAGTLGDRANDQGDVEAEVERDGDDWLYTLTADRAWLNSKDRVYPVSVDPTSVFGYSQTWAYKTNGQYNYNYGVQVGNTNTNGIWRTLVDYNYEQFFGNQIIDADIEFNGQSSDSTVTDRTGGAYWATNMSFNSAGEYIGQAVYWNGGGHVQDNLLGQRVARWVRDGTSGAVIVFTGDESNTFSYKHYGSRMWVAWRPFPTAGTLAAPAPSNGALNTTLTPTLKIAGSTFPEASNAYYWFKVSENPDPNVNPVWSTGWQTSATVNVPEVKLQPGKKYYWKAFVATEMNGLWGVSNERPSAVWNFTTASVPQVDKATAVPADKGVSVTTEPLLQVAAPANPANRTLKYWFRVATGADTRTGGVLNSGWVDEPSWQVPTGSLQDGTTYSWTVITRDVGYGVDSLTPWVATFSVNKRLGANDVSPMDAAGPVSVNLASGNVSMSFASPTVSTVGGPMGVSFTYDSQHP
ncbi:MAG TPA: hypothetical protein VL068_09310, partial [Microthrixaceae bacterium]|nr:hypothetical protein [Microthrixaceae bacterium]